MEKVKLINVVKDKDKDSGYQIVFPIPEKLPEKSKFNQNYYASCSNDEHHSNHEDMLKRYENCSDKFPDSACIIYYKTIGIKFQVLKHKLLYKLTADYESKFEKIYHFQIIDVLQFLK